jgi:hypothetical protein
MARAVHRHRSVRELGGGPRRRLRRRLSVCGVKPLTYRRGLAEERPSELPGRPSAAAGCGEGTIRRSPAVETSAPAQLSQPWRRDSAARAAARAEAGVPRPGLTGLDVGDCDSALSLLDRRFRASTITSCVRHRPDRDRRDLDHRAVAWPGGAVISSLPAQALLQLVQGAVGVSSNRASTRRRRAVARSGKEASRRGARARCSDSSRTEASLSVVSSLAPRFDRESAIFRRDERDGTLPQPLASAAVAAGINETAASRLCSRSAPTPPKRFPRRHAAERASSRTNGDRRASHAVWRTPCVRPSYPRRWRRCRCRTY